MDTILFDPETSIRRALILALGTYGPDALSSSQPESPNRLAQSWEGEPPGEPIVSAARTEPRPPNITKAALVAALLDLYQNDPDSGIHAAAEWALRQWNEQAKLKAAEARLPRLEGRGNRRWFANSHCQIFALIEGPVEFRMGSPPTEPDRDSDEVAHRRLISRKFANAAKEVSVRQYDEFVRENPGFGLDRSYFDKYSPDPDGPMIGITWFGGAAYCNWLSKEEGLPEAEWCYLRNSKGEYGQDMTIPADVFNRKGYRLPTEAESEYACRAGTITSRYHGLSVDLLGKYARYAGNGAEHAWPAGSLLPNDLGLFDMLGNVFEWCDDRQYNYGTAGNRVVTDNIKTLEHVDITVRLLRGGAFNDLLANVRSANRNRNLPTNRDTNNGFRLASTWRGMNSDISHRPNSGVDPFWSTPECAAKSRPPSRAGQR